MENFTIPVPDGTTNHGNPNLICTPVAWSDTFIFFAANYFAHAFTVKQLPGEELSQYAFVVLAAVLYPYCGLPRGIESIIRRAVFFRRSEMQTAARAGALCIVVRSHNWTPHAGQKPIQGVIMHANGRRKINSQDSESVPLAQRDDVELGAVQTSGNSSSQQVTLRIGHYLLNQRKMPRPSGAISGRKIHGLRSLPRGYELAILPDNATIIANGEAPIKDVHISSSYNLAQVIVSLVQLISSSVTLYRARGDQLDQYGYAAFGLTVLPYVTMSIVNFFGNLVTPNYQAVYMVYSAELEEAKSRGGTFDGTVGKIVQLPQPAVEDTQSRIASFYSSGDSFSVKLSDPGSETDESYQVGEEDVAPPTEGHGQFPYLDILSEPNRYSPVLEIPACSPFQLSGDSSDPDSWLTILGYLFVAIPYAVIGGLTRFQKRQSTIAQRVWIMMWLVFDTAFGYLAGRPDPINHDETTSMIAMVIVSAPAIGGFVVVGQMLKHYGNCLDINAGF